MEEQKAKGFTEEEAAVAEPNSLDAGAPPMNPVF